LKPAVQTTAPRLEASLNRYLAPLLRADGFAGSGRSFRRSNDDFIQVVQIQGSRHGGKFAINLGIQPLNMPDALGNTDHRKIKEELCEFRGRLTDSESRDDQWWQHEATAASMDDAVREAASVYEVTGRRILSTLAAKDSPLLTITPAQFNVGKLNLFGFANTKVRMARMFALMRSASGNPEDAHDFALIALANLGQATGLRKELEELARR
jgi:Domain of unknown function (DUF4304)